VAPTVVTAEAVRIFGDSVSGNGSGNGSATDSAPAIPVAPAWDIDVRSFETRSRVAFYVGRFTGEARPHFGAWLKRGGRYEPMIRAKLRAARLPEDLTYLALIESGYDPNAYSSAAAVGIWQLMTGTAQGTGLRVDWWIDERRDPVRATDGAIRFLGWLDQQFGSLFLAAAAYNGGPGRVARGLKRYADSLEGNSGDEAYFALAETDYLRAETRDYVPKLIAAAIVAKEPARYGFTEPIDPPLAYDSVSVGAAVPLSAVAKAAGLPLSVVRDLNFAVLRGITPPKGRWWVRVPVSSAAGLDSLLELLPKAERAAFKAITPKNNTTIKTLSAKYGITSRQFVWYNPAFRKSKSGQIAAGRTVLIPTAASLAGARDIPDPAIERYGSSRRGATHVVKKGETLGSIAAHYGTSVATLKKLNGLKATAIWPGQVLVVRPRGKKG
jgi:membrane-bound lytic murein transglycosylase D